jgi:hypothetical protein
VIERLATSVRQLAKLEELELDTEAGEQLRGDCADAVRLELDCPQQSLTSSQRSALSRLSDVLEAPGASSIEIIAAARAADAALIER